MAAVTRRLAPAAALLCLLYSTPAAAGPPGDESVLAFALPATIQVDPMLESVIARMLEKSPTFRRQCGKIAGARIVVGVRLVPASKNSRTRATTTLRRYTSGLMIADVEVPVATSLAPLIGHEFEHIAEFVEGVNLHALVAERPNEAVQRLDGAFETWRAVQAGHAVHAEVSDR